MLFSALLLIHYIAMVTALLLLNWKAMFWPWVIPTLVGTPLIVSVVRDIMRPQSQRQ